MKLYEALATKNSLHSQLVQLISLRDKTLEYPEDERPELDFDKLTTQIKDIVKRLTKLKLEIGKANMNTTLSNGKTLFENIIELGNLRSTINQIKDMIQVERRGVFYSERVSKDDVRMRKQKDTPSLLSMLQQYQQRKDALDSLIQQANQTVEIPNL